MKIESGLKIHEEYLYQSGHNKNSIRGKLTYLNVFLKFLKLIRNDLREVCEDDILEFIKYLNSRVSDRTGKPYTSKTKITVFGIIKQFFKCLYINDLILFNPVRDMVYRPKNSTKKKEILTINLVNDFLDSIDIYSGFGLRHRACYELMYSSGLRAGEVSALNIEDIDFNNRMILIRVSKFGKDRVVPVSSVAVKFLKLYIVGRKQGAVFTGKLGRLMPSTINKQLIELLKEKGIYREGLTSHSLRYSVATHLLSNVADLRYVQELLGHDSIETTVHYTHDLIENMKRIYRTYHYRENEGYREADEVYMARINMFIGLLKARKSYLKRLSYSKNMNKMDVGNE